MSAKESALTQLASVTAQLATLQSTIQEGGTPVVSQPIQGGTIAAAGEAAQP